VNIDTGETYSEKEYDQLIIDLRKAAKPSSHIMRLPSNIKDDSTSKLQNRKLSANERRRYINELHKRRKKNKLAKQSKRKNRK
jgi:hypothetical protein